MKASCFIFSYLKLYTTMPIAKLAAFLDMVRKPEVSFQIQTRKLFLSGSVNKLRFRAFTQNLPARSVELRSASGLTKRVLSQFCRTDHLCPEMNAIAKITNIKEQVFIIFAIAYIFEHIFPITRYISFAIEFF